jgi:hypothetical protein
MINKNNTNHKIQNKFMKKIILLLTFCITTNYAQEKNNSNFKVHSTSIGFGGFYIKNKLSEGGGASFFIDLSFAYKRNLFLVKNLNGAEIGIISGSNYNFNEISILYGRELLLAKWLSIEGFTGLGYYKQVSEISDIISGSVIAFPINMKIIFKVGKHFSIGSNNSYSINKINNNFSSNLAFGYIF